MNIDQEELIRKYAEFDLLDEQTMTTLKSYSKNSPEIVKDIIDSFEPEGSEIIIEIKTALDNRNPLLLKTATHSLAGISGSIGAIRLMEICKDTENAIKAGRIDLAFDNATLIFETYSEFISLLQTL